METDRYRWVLDWELFRQIRLPDLSWLEIVMIAVGLGTLLLYLLTVIHLDLRSRRRKRRGKQLAQLQAWLEAARLAPAELETLDGLAGGSRPWERYQFLSDPVQFETRVHQAFAEGMGPELGFVSRLREELRYTTGNLRAAIVSTRQLRPGDSVRLSAWEAGLPQHSYGRVASVERERFVLEIGERGARAALSGRGEADLFLLRGHGYEYRFPCRPARPPLEPPLLALRHALIDLEHGPRGMRLPLLLDVTYRERALLTDAVAELDPANAPSPPEKGVLFDLSEGGMALVVPRPVSPGRYVLVGLPVRRGRRTLRLTGRVLGLSDFGSGHWLVRCELRGLTGEERDYLRQVLRMEQRRRLHQMALVRRRARKAAPAGEGQAN